MVNGMPRLAGLISSSTRSPRSFGHAVLQDTALEALQSSQLLVGRKRVVYISFGYSCERLSCSFRQQQFSFLLIFQGVHFATDKAGCQSGWSSLCIFVHVDRYWTEVKRVFRHDVHSISIRRTCNLYMNSLIVMEYSELLHVNHPIHEMVHSYMPTSPTTPTKYWPKPDMNKTRERDGTCVLLSCPAVRAPGSCWI